MFVSRNNKTIREDEFVLVTKTKELCGYIFCVTEKSPKRYRFTITTRLQNLAMEALEEIYRANGEKVTEKESGEKRLRHQKQAKTALQLLAYIALFASEQGAVTEKQYENCSRQISECLRLLAGWTGSDERRKKTAGMRET